MYCIVRYGITRRTDRTRAIMLHSHTETD